jgi:uncharacterized DUF497 family protein
MNFEFDPAKSEANRKKHGIDFEQAQTLWQDPEGLEVPSKYPDEPRRLWIAGRQGKLWTAIFTKREDKIRIISVRRVRENERNAYYEQ